MVVFVFKILQNKIWEFLLNFALLATLGTERVNSCGIKDYKGVLLSRVLRDLASLELYENNLQLFASKA